MSSSLLAALFAYPGPGPNYMAARLTLIFLVAIVVFEVKKWWER